MSRATRIATVLRGGRISGVFFSKGRWAATIGNLSVNFCARVCLLNFSNEITLDQGSAG